MAVVAPAEILLTVSRSRSNRFLRSFCHFRSLSKLVDVHFKKVGIFDEGINPIKRKAGHFVFGSWFSTCYPRQLFGSTLSLLSRSGYQGQNPNLQKHVFLSSPSPGRHLSGVEIAAAGIAETVDQILRKTREKDIMADSLSIQSVSSLVATFVLQGFDYDQTKTILSSRLWLLQQPQATHTFTDILLSHGFSHALVCKLIEAIPYDLQNSLPQFLDGRISDSIFVFGSLGFSDKDIHAIFSISPQVLFLNVRKIETSIGNLKQIFSSKEIQTLVKTSPSILADEWPSVLEKYEYARYQMVYHNSDIVDSSLLSQPFLHIKNRHIFLVRCGLFIDVSIKLSPDLNPNPKLNEVVDGSNAAFLKVFPVCSLKEYNIYCQMRDIEEEMEHDGMDDFVDQSEKSEYDDFDFDVRDESQVSIRNASRTNMLSQSHSKPKKRSKSKKHKK